jgi:hypothetical protein
MTMLTWAISFVICATAQAALADPTICKYVDSEGNVVYSAVAPGKGLRLLNCDVLPSPEQDAERDRRWRATTAKVKLGMTTSELRAIKGLWAGLQRHRTVESNSATEEWLYFVDDFAVHLRNGRVATIFR